MRVLSYFCATDCKYYRLIILVVIKEIIEFELAICVNWLHEKMKDAPIQQYISETISNYFNRNSFATKMTTTRVYIHHPIRWSQLVLPITSVQPNPRLLFWQRRKKYVLTQSNAWLGILLEFYCTEVYSTVNWRKSLIHSFPRQPNWVNL